MKMYKSLGLALKERERVTSLKLTLKDAFSEELFDFPHLSELYLEGDSLELPQVLHWDKLKVLSLKFDQLRGNLSSVFLLSQLENLKIIETPVAHLLLPLGMRSSSLRFLTIKNCGLTELPEEISILEELRELYLPQNKLQNLPRSFHKLSLLNRLNLDQNEFTHFPELLTKMTKLTHLSLDGNLFTEEEKASIQRKSNIWVS